MIHYCKHVSNKAISPCSIIYLKLTLSLFIKHTCIQEHSKWGIRSMTEWQWIFSDSVILSGKHLVFQMLYLHFATWYIVSGTFQKIYFYHSRGGVKLRKERGPWQESEKEELMKEVHGRSLRYDNENSRLSMHTWDFLCTLRFSNIPVSYFVKLLNNCWLPCLWSFTSDLPNHLRFFGCSHHRFPSEVCLTKINAQLHTSCDFSIWTMHKPKR